MKLTQHGDNLWKLTRYWVMNCYLVREGDGLTLVDTTIGGASKGILQAAEAIGLPITRIALTHAHGDHAGALDEVAALVPSAEVAFTRRTAEFLKGRVALQDNEPQAKIRGSFYARDTGATTLLEPGDKLGSLRVIAAPGHSPDQVAFYDERDGALIAGDAFQTQGGIAVAGVVRWKFPITALATWHLPTALETAVVLRALEPRRLAVGHGQVLENPREKMSQAIREAERKIHAQAQTA